ncbi:MAG: hypothetical protein M1825_003143 [Sarcosagium campestre]|nr:MAG: hypothetical protein M1825_003143 [Sarcosagium campestre]
MLAAASEPPAFSQPGFDLGYLHPQQSTAPSNDYSPSTASDLTLVGDQPPSASPLHLNTTPRATPTPRRSKDNRQAGGMRGSAAVQKESVSMAATDVNGSGGNAPADLTPTSSRPKRVRTGCLTCRERHLKCDEGLPHCQNCRKSSRECKRGVRLNFIDTQVQDPPIIPPSRDWSVQFQDESREIASEYRGGAGRYPVLEPAAAESAFEFENDGSAGAAAVAAAAAAAAAADLSQHLPSMQSTMPASYPEMVDQTLDDHHRDTSRRPSQINGEQDGFSAQSIAQPPNTSYSNPEQTLTPPSETKDYLNSPEEVLFMQVFVEEVGLWMDSMDSMKHFSRILPFHSLGEPMLLNAFLACGARHLTLVNSAFQEDKALHYYDTATRGLLKSLQNPNRDSVICATTAVILNVYEIMSERAQQRMHHIAGARALIKECGWSARSGGIGGACFWLNVGMELLSCLHFNWQVAWDPDSWGVDADFSRETESGREEVWTHKILYVVARIANFRASIPRFQEPSARDEQTRLHNRYKEWTRLKELCDLWNDGIPRTMHPMAYLYPHQTASKSAFPEVWLIKRTTIVARLFYHTAMCLLAQINPCVASTNEAMHEMQVTHSHQICGIAAHVKDRGVASVAIRSLAIAAEVLVVRHEQEEVLQIFAKIKRDTGWRVDFLNKELKEKWGWPESDAARQRQNQTNQGMLPLQGFPQFAPQAQTTLPPAPPVQRRTAGITNPLMATADFSSQHHPYQSYYVAPNQHQHHSQYGF